MRQESQYKNVENLVVSGDFNTEISEVDQSLSENLNLQYVYEGETPFNSENRVQYRNRDGQHGMDVI
jgi:hypothetical protein